MYQANVYKIMFGSPSDIVEEVEIFKQIIAEWNSNYSESQNIVLMPIHWKADSYSTAGNQPQKLLNNQLTDKSDILIAVFGTRLGSPTNTHLSGTIEEIEEHLENQKPVMVFFRQNVNGINSINPEQLRKLNEFKESIQDKSIYIEYNEESDFRNMLTQQLAKVIRDNTQSITSISNNNIAPNYNIELSNFDIERLEFWAKSNNTTFMSIQVNEGTIYFLGDKQYMVSVGREKAEWKGFLNRLLKLDFIVKSGVNKQGDILYELTVNAYNYVDSL